MKKLFAFSMLMALALVSAPAFADEQGTRSQNQLFSITVPSYFNVTKQTGAVDTTGLTVTTATNTNDHVAKQNTQLTVTYLVSTNIPADATNTKLALTAKTGTNNLPALYPAADPKTGRLVFVKSDIDAVSTALNSAGSESPTVTANADTIALDYSVSSATYNPATGGDAQNLPAPSSAANEVDYTMQPGYNTLTITFGQASTAISTGTFSMLDRPGTYTATLYADGPAIP